jgi:ABC-2 type transport system permease protein
VTIYELCLLNPFTYVVELIRFTIYREPNLMALGIVVATFLVFGIAALVGYTPARGGPAAGRGG